MRCEMCEVCEIYMHVSHSNCGFVRCHYLYFRHFRAFFNQTNQTKTCIEAVGAPCLQKIVRNLFELNMPCMSCARIEYSIENR